MLEPQITACLSNCCNSITIDEVTGFYSENNTGGWNNSSTVFRDEAIDNDPYVVDATLTITYNGTLISTVDVTDVINDAIFPQYELYKYESESLQDGVYIFNLTITDSNEDEYETDYTLTVFCNVKCCIRKMQAKFAAELYKDYKSEAYENYILALSIFNSLKYVTECEGTDEFTKLLTKLQKICNQSKCGCGC